jgi:hypothetical protein
MPHVLNPQAYPPLSIAARLYWTMGGVVLVPAAGLTMILSQPDPNVQHHMAYWGIVLSLILVRLVDVVLLRGHTLDCHPATLAHWKAYSRIVLGVSAIGWLAVYFITRTS